jgi:hypothetical protein
MRRQSILLVSLAVLCLGLITFAEAATPPDLLNTTWVGPVRIMLPDGSVINSTGASHFTAQSEPRGLYAGYFGVGGGQPIDFTMQVSTNKKITMAFVPPQPGFYFIGEGQLTGKNIKGVLRGIFEGATYELTLTKQ